MTSRIILKKKEKKRKENKQNNKKIKTAKSFRLNCTNLGKHFF